MRTFRTLVLGLSAAILLGPFAAQAAGPSGAPCKGVSVDRDWLVIDAPAFPELDSEVHGAPSQEIAAYAIDPYRPERLWATNGLTVMASDDGGCSWTERFSLGLLPSLDVPTSGAVARVHSIVIPEIRGASDTIYLVVEDRVEATARPHVIKSSDGGATWSAADEGLPAVGAPLRLKAAPSNPDILYLLVNVPGATSTVFASEDGAGTWEERGVAPNARDFDIDDLAPEDLWLWGGYLLRSRDGGRNSIELNFVAPPVLFADVFHAPGRDARVVAYEYEGPAFARSDDGAKTWRHFRPPPGDGVSFTGGHSADGLVMSNHGAIYRFRPPGYWTEITPGIERGIEARDDYEPIRDLVVDRSDDAAVFGFRADSILKYTRFSLDLPPLAPEAPPEIAEDVSLVPQHRRVNMRPGETRTIDYRLQAPPQPTPLDVFFLMDTTISMRSPIRGLLAGIHQIVDELSRARIDARFGVGEYKDYPLPAVATQQGSGDFPYRRNRDIGPADDSLVAAIEMMEASGGGDPPESQLSALYQVATGAGESPWIEVGEQANFRPDALKVVVHITDAPFRDSAAHPGPRFDAVARELQGRGILQVGLAPWGQHGRDSRDYLERMATATGALAPSSGVDCDGDGTLDRRAGEPIVCDILESREEDAVNLVPAIIGSLRAVTDLAPVGLATTGGDRFVAGVDPQVRPEVNVKDPLDLTFSVTYSCPPVVPSRGDTELVATVGDVGIARATAQIVCAIAPAAVVPPRVAPPPAPPEPVPAIVPAPAPVPPPAPVTQAQPQPNPHVQGALAAQERKQLQTAAAGIQVGPGEEEYAFSSYQRRGRAPGPEVAMLYASALALSFGFARAALSLRRRSRVAPARR